MNIRWETLYNHFDPEEPVSFEHREWRVERTYSLTEKLKPVLGRPFGDKQFLIIGTVGSGKSTELYQLAEARTERDFVVVVDLWDFFNNLGDPAALDHIEPWEVIFLVGLHVYKAAQSRGHVWPKQRTEALEKARKRFEDDPKGASLSVPKLAEALVVTVGGILGAAGGPAGAAGGVGGAKIALAGLEKLAGAGTWDLRVGGRKLHPLDQDEKVKTLLAAVSALIGDLNLLGRPVACFIDGLDRIREAETVEALFLESSLLGKLPCATVLTGPIRIHRDGQGLVVRQFRVRLLHNIPVVDPHVPLEVTPEGARFFREAWRVRAGEAAAALPEAHLDRLAWACGGRPRHFMAMIREVIGRCYDGQLDQSTDDIIESVIDDERRNLEMGITKEDIDLLQEIRTDRKLSGKPGTAALLQTFRLLPYPNETEWYYPHPLLLLKALAG